MPTNDTPRTDEQRNVMLAKAIGWKPDSDTYHEVWKDRDGETVCMDSSDWAVQSHNAFHAHVVLVLEERGKRESFMANLKDGLLMKNRRHPTEWDLFAAPLDILCDAAIEVLEGGDDEPM